MIDTQKEIECEEKLLKQKMDNNILRKMVNLSKEFIQKNSADDYKAKMIYDAKMEAYEEILN